MRAFLRGNARTRMKPRLRLEGGLVVAAHLGLALEGPPAIASCIARSVAIDVAVSMVLRLSTTGEYGFCAERA
jgi:hypothetical protein